MHIPFTGSILSNAKLADWKTQSLRIPHGDRHSYCGQRHGQSSPAIREHLIYLLFDTTPTTIVQHTFCRSSCEQSLINGAPDRTSCAVVPSSSVPSAPPAKGDLCRCRVAVGIRSRYQSQYLSKRFA